MQASRWCALFARYLLISLFIYPIVVSASDTDTHLHSLAQHPVWLKLLHYEQTEKKSEVISDDFFLAKNGAIDPYAELKATLDAYQRPWSDSGDTHPRCRFPARYYWLDQQLKLPGYHLRDPRCKMFEQWALLDKIDSISLLLVSGYYGNPASTFGHSLLKLNSSDNAPGGDLFDLTINFGAMVPPNEPIILYITRGLTGGYDAAFSDRYYYAQDLVYTRTEFRDIWDYRLNLSEAQRTLLLLHLWEIMGKHFIYYFLSDNCASRLSELLELVTSENFLAHSSVWYTPIETYHTLEKIDLARQANNLPPLVEKVTFIPSSQRNLYEQAAQLDERELTTLNNVIRDGPDSLNTDLGHLAVDGQVHVSSALLAYYQYRITAEQPEPSPEMMHGKDLALYKRLTLPVSDEKMVTAPALKSPAESSPPLLSGVGVGQLEGGDKYLNLLFTPYSYKKLARNSRDNDEMSVLSTVLAVDSHHRVFVDRFDLVRVRALHTEQIPIEGEARPSWQVRIGSDAYFVEDKYKYDANGSFGIGVGSNLGRKAVLYGMVDLAAHSYPQGLTIEPNVGANYVSGAFRGELAYRLISDPVRDELTEKVNARIQLQIDKDEAFRMEFSHRDKSNISISYLHYW